MGFLLSLEVLICEKHKINSRPEIDKYRVKMLQNKTLSSISQTNKFDKAIIRDKAFLI